MVNKNIHIVFQVLNFLHSDHHSAMITSGTEHRVLTNLASHKGDKGIFPSIPTIAKELKLGTRVVYRAIQKWVSLNIIEIESDAGKNNHYLLYIPKPTPVASDTGVSEDTPVVHDTPPLSLETHTPVASDTIYNKEELSNNKKLLYAKSVDNSKRHDFADSMDSMANEDRHIREHEERKNMEMSEESKRFARQMIGQIQSSLMRKP